MSVAQSVHPRRSWPLRHAGAPPGSGARRASWPSGHVVRAGGRAARRGFARPIDDESLRAAIQAVLPDDADGRTGKHQVASRHDRRGRRHPAQELGAPASTSPRA